MTGEKIKQGEEFLKKLSWLKDQKRRWEAGQEIKRLELCNRSDYGHIDRVMEVSNSFINFEELKLLAIARIERRLKEVQTEFDNL